MKLAPAVTVDARWLAGGVGTYALNIVRELRRLNSSIYLRVLAAPNASNKFAPFCDEIRTVNAPIFSVREQFEVAQAAGGSGVLHCTHYNAPVLRRGPLVVTMPDVTPLIDCYYHTSRKSRLLSSVALRTIARRADHIITVSEYSRAQIVDKLQIPAGKISVGYNGVGDSFRPMDSQLARAICADRLGIREPFLLYVGNLRRHKNVGTLLQAYKHCRQAYRIEQRLVLIVSGTPEARNSLRRLAVELGISEFVHLVGPVDEADLVAAYNAAAVLVAPSLEEGFCLPVVEAMACGTPVACSDASALPEIAGDAAGYFDPRYPADIADTVVAVLEKADLRHYMRARGFAHAARYSWAQSAQIHLDVYSQFIDLCATSQRCNEIDRTGSERVPLAHAVPTTRL